MIPKTKQVFEKTIKDLRTADFVRSVVTLIISISYLSYRIYSDVGNLPISIILLTLHSIYLIVYVGISIAKNNTAGRKLRKDISVFYKWAKRIMLFLMAYTTLISVLDAPKNVTELSIVFAILLPIGLILQIVFDFILYYVGMQLKLLKEGIESDFGNIKKQLSSPISATKFLVSNFRERKQKKESLPASQNVEKLEDGVVSDVSPDVLADADEDLLPDDSQQKFDKVKIIAENILKIANKALKKAVKNSVVAYKIVKSAIKENAEKRKAAKELAASTTEIAQIEIITDEEDNK